MLDEINWNMGFKSAEQAEKVLHHLSIHIYMYINYSDCSDGYVQV